MLFALLNLALVSLGYAIAYREDRWSHATMGPRAIPYLKHGGVWADAFLLTPVVYIIQEHTSDWTLNELYISFGLATTISIIAHGFWANLQTIPGHVIEPSGIGLGKLPIGGWYHVFYMAVLLGLVIQFYLFTPEAPKLVVSILLSIFVIPSTMQPGWYISKVMIGKGVIDRIGWAASVLLWAIIWVGYALT